MTRFTTLALLFCAAILAVPCARAQTAPDSLLRLKPGTTVRVETLALLKFDSALLRATGDTLVVAGAPGQQTNLPLRDLNAVWKRGRATKTGAVIGGIVGAVGLGILGAFVGGIAEGEGADTTAGSGAVYGAIGGAAGGALVGALIGSAIPKWHRCYP